MADDVVDPTATTPTPDAPPAQPAGPTEAERKAQDRAEAAERRASELEAKHRRELEEIAAYLRVQQPQQPAQPAADEDPDAIVSRKDLKAHGDEIAQRVGNVLTQAEIANAKHLRSIHRANFVRSRDEYEHAEEFKDEIERMVDALPPLAQAQPDIYDRTYQVVVGLHAKELKKRWQEDAIKRHEAAKLEQGDDYEAPEAVPARPAAPIPAGDAAGVRTAVPRKPKHGPLTPDEKLTVERFFKGDVSRYIAARDGTLERDFLGAKGRSRF